MKKVILTGLLAIAALALSSCDMKHCKCYVYDGTSVVATSEYVSEGSACASLDYQNGTHYRRCIEDSEPDIDPGSIGREYKGM